MNDWITKWGVHNRITLGPQKKEIWSFLVSWKSLEMVLNEISQTPGNQKGMSSLV